ncbi:MAG TPA: divalent-cation tolerance protein CutA [Nitrosospira sp.]|nr:divalent-cation tolerance protein CutA [Nitrosospira sp.]
MNPILVITTMPDRASAISLAEALVDERLAACVNVLADCTSVYRWEGKSEAATEVPVFIKTTEQNYSRLEQRIMSMHPYELPELIAVPISDGLPGYLKWIETETLTLDSKVE